MRALKQGGLYFRFEADGKFIPNSHLPLFLYPQGILGKFGTTKKEFLENLANTTSRTGWYIGWTEGTIYRRWHFHSITHELLVIYRGSGVLRFGSREINKEFTVLAGDAILVPAGVGHIRINSSIDFAVAGVYPDGQTYDMQWGWRKNYVQSVENIKRVPLPKEDPLGSGWLRFWNRDVTS